MTLEDRISHLENLFLALSKWTKFNDDKLLQPLIDRISPSTSRYRRRHQPTYTTEVKLEVKKDKTNNVAKKSTGGVSKRGTRKTRQKPRNSATRKALSATMPKSKKKNTNNNKKSSTAAGGDDILNSIDITNVIKVETEVRDEEYVPHSDGEWFFGNANDNDDINNEDDQLDIPHTDDGSSSRDFDMEANEDDDSDDDFSMDDEDYDNDDLHEGEDYDEEEEAASSSSLQNNNKRNKRRQRLEACPPLRIPVAVDNSINSDGGPLVTLQNLSAAELKQMNVKLVRVRRNRNNGIELEEDSKEHTCCFCPDLKFLTIAEKRAHRRKFHPAHFCKYCKIQFNTRTEFLEHKKVTHGTRLKRVCPICSREFFRKVNLETHLRSHTGEKPYLCYFCGRGMASSNALRAHMRSQHENPDHKRYKCDQCPAAFKCMLSLTKHRAKQHDPASLQMHPCKLCTGEFTDVTKLKRHINDVHNDKRSYACHICGQVFKRAEHMRKHVNNHDNPNRRKRRSQHKPYLKWEPKPNDEIEQETGTSQEENQQMVQGEGDNAAGESENPVALSSSSSMSLQHSDLITVDQHEICRKPAPTPTQTMRQNQQNFSMIVDQQQQTQHILDEFPF